MGVALPFPLFERGGEIQTAPFPAFASGRGLGTGGDFRERAEQRGLLCLGARTFRGRESRT